jgi:hypothetical protein
MLNYYITIAPNESVVKETGLTWWNNTVEDGSKEGSKKIKNRGQVAL